MTSTPPAYRTMVSPRSRRLRSVGLVLLVAAVTMALYGFFVLMPSLQHSIPTPVNDITIISGKKQPAPTAKDMARQLRKERRVATAKVLFAYGYWSVCGLLVIGMVFIAWLDTREVSRNYLNERRSVWLEAARNIPHDGD